MANDAQRQRLARKLSYLNQSALLFWRMIFNGSARQTDFVNISKWEAPTGGAAPVSYRIYRDSTLTKAIAVVRANKKLRFEDHDRKQGKTYSYFMSLSIKLIGDPLLQRLLCLQRETMSKLSISVV